MQSHNSSINEILSVTDWRIWRHAKKHNDDDDFRIVISRVLPDLQSDIEIKRFNGAVRRNTQLKTTAPRFNSINQWCIVRTSLLLTIDNRKNHRLPKSFFCADLCRSPYAYFNNLFHTFVSARSNFRSRFENHKYFFFTTLITITIKSTMISFSVRCCLLSLARFALIWDAVPLFLLFVLRFCLVIGPVFFFTFPTNFSIIMHYVFLPSVY